MRETHTRRKTGTALLAALLLGSALGPVTAQNAGAGNGAGNGGAGVGGNNGGIGTGGNAGASGGATGNGGTAGGNNNGTTGTGANGQNGDGATGAGTGAVNGSTGTGTNGALSDGSSPGGSIQTTNNPAPQRYDLARTVADALKSSADVETATRNVQIDKKQADVQAAQGRPNINAQGTATRYDAATKVAFGGSATGTSSGTGTGGGAAAGPMTITVLPNATQVLSLNLNEDFDIDGQIRAATEQYDLLSQADRFTLQQVTDARILRAKSVYFNFLETYHQVQVAQTNLADARQNLQDAQNQNAAGTGLKLDLLRAQTQVAQDEFQLAQAQNNFGVAESTFNDLVGRPLNTPITLDDVPGVTVGTTPGNNGTVGAPTDQTLFQPPDLSGLDLDKSIITAYAHRPEIQGDKVNVRVDGIGITLARAGLEPTLNGSINGFYYPTTDFQTPRKRVAQATITLTIPIYDGNRAHDLIQEAHLRQDNAQTTLDSEISDVTLDVRQSYLNLITAATQIASANSQLQSAVAARQNAEIRYRGGVGLFLEVTDAQAALVQAQNTQINAVYNYLVAQAQFQNALGTPQTQ